MIQFISGVKDNQIDFGTLSETQQIAERKVTIKNTSWTKCANINVIEVKSFGPTFPFATKGIAQMKLWPRGEHSFTVQYVAQDNEPTSSGELMLHYTLGKKKVYLSTYLTGSKPVISENPTEEPKEPAIGLRAIGNKIFFMGSPIILRGLNIADPEHLNTKTWERPNINAQMIADKAVALGANVIRLPILPGTSQYPNEGLLNTPANYVNKHLVPLVTNLTSRGIFVIVDLHYVSNYDTTDIDVKAHQFWSIVAPLFADNPYVIYEIFNEPINPNDWNTWKVFADSLIKTIRTFAPDNLLLVGGPYWSSNIVDCVVNPVNDNNVAYVAHVYSNQKQDLWDKRYKAVADKYPLFITEWGFETGGTEGGDINFGQAFNSWLETNRLSWTVWCYDTKWGPRMVHDDWTLRKSPEGMGEFVASLLK